MIFFVGWKTNWLVFYLHYHKVTVISYMFLSWGSQRDYHHKGITQKIVNEFSLVLFFLFLGDIWKRERLKFAHSINIIGILHSVKKNQTYLHYGTY